MIDWQWKSFAALSAPELYQILALRSEVFVVEQNCVYLDPDGLDQVAWHLWAHEAGQVRAYLRVLPPGVKFAEVSLGRVISHASVRGSGLGQALLARGLQQIEQQYGQVAVRISAQLYLQRFYQGFGFQVCGEAYDEDGIPHVEMLRPANLPLPNVALAQSL